MIGQVVMNFCRGQAVALQASQEILANQTGLSLRVSRIQRRGWPGLLPTKITGIQGKIGGTEPDIMRG